MLSRWPKTPPPDDAPRPRPADSALKSGAKKVASKALDAAGPAMSAGSHGAGTGVIALATGAAAASATGIGLVVVGALASAGAAAKSIVAAKSSKEHRDELMFINMVNRWREFPCMIPPEAAGEPDIMAHQRIAYNVLPYAIEQKNRKFQRKAIGSVPVLGTIPMAIRQAYRAATKDDKGLMRSQMAHELAVHLITHNCALAQAIVSELFSSYEKMLWMLDQDTDVLTPLFMEKLKSV